MSWYKRACLLSKFAKMVRDIVVDESFDAFEENVENLHELEFKAHQIAISPANIMPKRKQNILKRIQEKGWEHFVSIRNILLEAFKYWKSLHQIQTAETWAEMVINIELRESSYGENKLVEGILKDGIEWGQSKLLPDQIVSEVDKDQVRTYKEEEIRNNLEGYEYDIEQWLNKTYLGWEKEGLNAIEYVQGKMLEDDYIDNFMNRWTEEDIIAEVKDLGMYGLIDEAAIKRAIAKYLYPEYMSRWGNDVGRIIEEVDGVVAGLESVNEDDSISKMTSAVSLALNVMHVNGNIGGDFAGYDDKFLDEISNLDTTEWEKEVGTEFGV